MNLKRFWRHKTQIVMFLSFIYGGFSLLAFFFRVYQVFWRQETFNALRDLGGLGGFGGPDGFGLMVRHRIPEEVANNLPRLLSPQDLALLFGGLVSIAAGITIWGLTRKKEARAIQLKTMDLLLSPDEKKVFSILRGQGAITQSALVRETGLSKVKVHRVVKKLESQGILSKHQFGLTNKLLLNKEFAGHEEPPHLQTK